MYNVFHKCSRVNVGSKKDQQTVVMVYRSNLVNNNEGQSCAVRVYCCQLSATWVSVLLLWSFRVLDKVSKQGDMGGKRLTTVLCC